MLLPVDGHTRPATIRAGSNTRSNEGAVFLGTNGAETGRLGMDNAPESVEERVTRLERANSELKQMVTDLLAEVRKAAHPESVPPAP